MKRFTGVRIVKVILFGLGAAAVVCAALFAAWYHGLFLPSWIRWIQKSDIINETETFDIQLNNRHLTFSCVEEGYTWSLDSNIPVQDYLFEDIDHDGSRELMILCWKIGRYGSSRPFWITHDEMRWSQHIYIYRWLDGRIHAVWMASDIGMDAVSWQFDETGRLAIVRADGSVSHWDWVSWGLSCID